MLNAGDVLADYTVMRPIGVGGTAHVYLARHGAGDPIALKVARVDGASDAAVHRLDREFEVAALLRDDRVVAALGRGAASVRRAGVASGPARDWLALRFVDGPPATALVPRGREQPDVVAVCRVLADVAGALDHAHALGILHRDVKPGNVLVEGAGAAAIGLLSDFGSATIGAPATPDGGREHIEASIHYVAPEVLRGRDATAASDEYAFAATAFELLTGAPPFPRATTAAIIYAHLHEDPPAPERIRPWLPGSLTSVFAKALAKRPEERYRTCAELARILTGTLRDVEPPVRGTRPGRRRRIRG